MVTVIDRKSLATHCKNFAENLVDTDSVAAEACQRYIFEVGHNSLFSRRRYPGKDRAKVTAGTPLPLLCRSLALKYEYVNPDLALHFVNLASSINPNLHFLENLSERIRCRENSTSSLVRIDKEDGLVTLVLNSFVSSDRDPFPSYVAGTVRRFIESGHRKVNILFSLDNRNGKHETSLSKCVNKLYKHLTKGDEEKITVLNEDVFVGSKDVSKCIELLKKSNTNLVVTFTGPIGCEPLSNVLFESYPIVLCQTNSRFIPFKSKFDLVFLNHADNLKKLPFLDSAVYMPFKGATPDKKFNMSKSDIGAESTVIVSALSRDRIGLQLKKKPEILREIVSFISENNVVWHILGQSSLYECYSIDERLDHLISARKIVCMEYVDDFQEYLSACDIFLNVPYAPGGGIGSRWAIENGLPVVGLQDSTDASRWLAGNFSPVNVADLFERIKKLIVNDEERTKLNKLQKELVESFFSDESMAEFSQYISSAKKRFSERQGKAKILSSTECSSRKEPFQSIGRNTKGTLVVDDVLVKWDFTSASDRLIVTFGTADKDAIISRDTKADPDLDPWGYKFVRKYGDNVLSFASIGRANWYRSPKYLDFIKGAAPVINSYGEILGYGMSMGAFGVSSFANIIEYSRVLLYYPISTLNSDLAPFETRYQFARSLDWKGPCSDGAASELNGYIIYDPFHYMDACHAKRYKGLTRLRANFLGHGFADLMNKDGSVKNTFQQFYDQSLSEQSFAATIKVRRRIAKYYNTMLSGQNRHLSQRRTEVVKNTRNLNRPLIRLDNRSMKVNQSSDKQERTLILHVGAHKTGTTTIQRSLEAEAGSLKKKGVAFIPFYEYHGKYSLRDFFKSGCSGSKEWERRFTNIKNPVTVISAEEISLYSKSELIKVQKYFTALGYNIETHYFIREPISWKQSDCKQIVRSGTGFLDQSYNKSLKQRYLDIPKKLDSVFGLENVRFHIFEEAIKNGLMSYFVNNCMLNSSVSIRELRQNESLSDTALKFANWNNEVSKKGSNRSMLFSEIINSIPGDTTKILFGVTQSECDDVNKGLEYIESRIGRFTYKRITPVSVDGKSLISLEQQDVLSLLSHTNEKLLELDEKIPLIRELAKQAESKGEISKAIEILELAKLIRPNGPFILQKLSKLKSNN